MWINLHWIKLYKDLSFIGSYVESHNSSIQMGIGMAFKASREELWLCLGNGKDQTAILHPPTVITFIIHETLLHSHKKFPRFTKNYNGCSKKILANLPWKSVYVRIFHASGVYSDNLLALTQRGKYFKIIKKNIFTLLWKLINSDDIEISHSAEEKFLRYDLLNKHLNTLLMANILTWLHTIF